MSRRFDIKAEQYDSQGRRVKDIILSFNVLDERTYLHIENEDGKGHTKRCVFDTLSLLDNVEEIIREKGSQ